MHIWLAPFQPGHSHLITIEFNEIVTIAMIRIWVLFFCLNKIITTETVKLKSLNSFLELQQKPYTFLSWCKRYYNIFR